MMSELEAREDFFLRIPSNPLQLLEHCINVPYDTLKHHLYNDSSHGVTDWHFSTLQLPQILTGLHLNLTEESILDTHCPALYIESTIAHASFAVSSIIMLTHFIMVLAINGDLLKLYGPCLLTSLGSSALHSALLFVGAYARSPLQQLDSNLSHVVYKSNIINQSSCVIASVLVHWTALTMHLSVMFGLVEKYQRLRLLIQELSIMRPTDCAYKRNPLKCPTPLCTTLNSEHQPILHTLSHQKPNPKITFPFTRRSDDPNASDKRYAIFAQNSFVRKHHCCPKECHIDWNWLGPPLSILLPLVPVSYGLFETKTYSLESSSNPVYGMFDCGGVGSCLLAFQWLFYLPLGAILMCDLVLVVLISIKSKFINDVSLCAQQYSPDLMQYESQFQMHCKFTVSQLLPWIIAFVSNFVCLVTLWQLFAIFTGLQSLYLIVSFVFSRPFLEVIFKRNDPLVRLKLDTLVMHLPIGVCRTREDASATVAGHTLPNTRTRNKTVLKVT